MSRRRCSGGAVAVLLAVMSAGSPAGADWRDEIGAFRVGILAGADIQASMARAEPFRLALEEALGVTVEIFPARDYPALINASAAARIEYTVFSAAAYALTWERCQCVEPLVIARSGDGTDTFSAVVVTRVGGPGNLAALRGTRIGVVRTTAFGGRDVALAEMRAQGFDPAAGDASLETFANGEEAVDALRQGGIDALIGWSSLTGDPAQGYSRGTLRRIAELEGDATGYRIAWQSSPVPHRMHAVRKNLPGEAKTQLRTLLTGLFANDPVAYDSVEPVYGGGFVAARQGQFEALAGLVAAAAAEEPAAPQ
ncbi:MAG: phosphonate ABC transporter substrate-binding protein [Alphaproteobacteria bacterium]|nr:MAG: phosphonate ABC transporter substrate-binding protein [Alphaproteobacteria bacterium]